MKHSRFNRVLFALFCCLSFVQIGQAQTTIDSVTCLCADDGPRVRDSIIIETGGTGPWWISDYSGKTLIPDSTLWHEADINLPGGEGYYLAPDVQYQPKDTLIDQGGGRFVLVTYRDQSVGFSGITITNGTDVLTTSYPVCTPAGSTEGLAGMDTVCLNAPESYMLTGILATDLDSATWRLTEVGSGSGSTFIGFSNSFTFTSPGVYTIDIEGVTTIGCGFSVSDSVLVINNIYPMTGPSFACESGDTTVYKIDGDILSTYDSIVWEVIGVPATFLSDSVNVDSVMIAWPMSAASADVVYTALSSDHDCMATDTISVMIADTLGASVAGDTLLCLGDMGTYTAIVNNLDTILWTISSPNNTIGGDPRSTMIDVIFNEAGLDTIYVEGVTNMGCPVFDTIIVDVKDSQVLLNGSTALCVGPDTIGYTAMYSDATLADFQSISWQVTPMVGDMDTMLFRTDPNGPYDSLAVVWPEIGDYEIIVEGMTGDACMLSDTIAVSVQDTSYRILGPSLACFLDPAQYVIVQASDSSDAISMPVTWTIMRGEIGGIFTEEVSMVSNDTIEHGFLLGTFADPNVTYLVKAEGMSDNGCIFADSVMVNVLGRNDLRIEGPEEACAGTRDTFFYVNIPDSLFEAPPVWNVLFANGNPYPPQNWTPVGGDSLRLTLPNAQDTLNISLTGTIAGAQCDATITTKQIITTDMISFNSPVMDTMCLDMDSTIFTLNVDSMDVNFGDPFLIALYDNTTNAFIQNMPFTSSGMSLATYVRWPGPGEYRIEADGYTNNDCVIDEEIIITVKDTNYIITGDPQICLGDTMEFAFLQGWDNMPIDSTINGDSVIWSFTFNGGATKHPLSGSGYALDGSGAAFINAFKALGPYGDSIRVGFDSVGTYKLFAAATTECGDCDVDAMFELIVRGTEFSLLGPDVVCNGSTQLYNIANLDSSRIIDLVPDSTMWSLASGLSGQFTGDPQADSIFINWNRPGSYLELNDTLYFSGMTNDGCVIRDTLPIVINTNDFMLLGDGAVCAGDPIMLELVNAVDSSLIAGLDSIIWIINGTDTIETPSIDTLDRLDLAMPIDSTTWPEGGVYTVQALGTTTSGCLINEIIDITVFGAETAEIMGDMNTCLGSVRFPTDPDEYTINIPSAQITSIMWEIIPQVGGGILGPDDDFSVAPTTSATDEATFTVTNWGSFGYEDPALEDYRIRVSGTTLGGCAFADSMDIIVLSTSEAFPMICNNAVNISLPHSCELILTPDMILENWEFIRDSLRVPEEQFEVIVTDEETGLMISDQGIVDGSLIGKELKVSVVHECSQQSCWGIVVLEDKNIPDLLCGRDTIGCADDFDPEDLDFGDLRLLGYPVPDSSSITVTPIGGSANTYVVRGFEQCGDATLEYQDRIEREICDGDFGTIIYRDWKMTNQAGLMSTCTDTIFVERLSLDSFIMMFEAELRDTTFECGQNVTGFANPSFMLDEFCFNIQYTSSEQRTLLCDGNENTYTATKTWTFLDWCTGQVRTLQQTITVDDNTGPNIFMRENDIRTQADEHHCFGIIELDNDDIRISDLCSPITSIKVRVFEDEITGLLIAEEVFDTNDIQVIISDPNILLDLTKIFVTVEATDQCGNLTADTVSRMVIVDDNVMPTAACDDIVTVNLNDEGWGLASYLAFDRGSNDNCGPVDICITRLDDQAIFDALDTNNDDLVIYDDFLEALMDDLREGTNYSGRTTMIGGNTFLHRDSLCTNRLKFECIDAMSSFLGNNVIVEMKVTDINGRMSTCESEVEVRDNGVVDTVLVVQGDLTLDCDDDYSQYIPFDGDRTVRFLTNCGIPIAPEYSIDTSGLTNCGNGVIKRTFTATDQIGQVFTHTQMIMIGDPDDLIDPDNIAGFWPIDYEGPGCPGSNISMDNLDPQYVPDFDPADYPCSEAELYHTDIVFRNVEGYCAKVLRTWTLVDWCQMRTGDPDAGMWEYVQVYKLSDEDDPVIMASAIEERSTTNANTCNTFVSLTVEADDCHDDEDLEWMYSITNDGSQIASGNTNTINSNFDVGTYSINWTVADPCGNMDTFVQSLVIFDGVAPAMACVDVDMDFGANNSLTITADMFAGNTSDGGCTVASDLEFFFGSVAGNPSMTIDCDDLAGETSRSIPLTIVARDAQGNVGECDVMLNLTDSQNACGNEPAGQMTPTSFLNFDGVDDIVTVAPNDEFNSVNFTVEAWVNPCSMSRFDQIVGKTVPGAFSAGFNIYLNDDGRVTLNCNWAAPSITSTTALNTGEWAHVAASFDGDLMRLYIDGVLEAERSLQGFAILAHDGPFTIGSDAGRYFFDGSISEVRFWADIRTEEELLSTSTDRITGAEEGLVAYYPLNDGSCVGSNVGAESAADMSSNGYNGELIDFALTGSSSNWVCAGLSDCTDEELPFDTDETTTATLSGEITTELDLTIDNVAVSLYSGSNEMAAMSTAIDGRFTFSDVATADNYQIKAKRDDDYLNGVTTLDLVLIQRHVLGLRLLDSPYKVIAADVDGSNSISAADLVAMRKLLLGEANDLPIQKPWTFVDASETFEDQLRPFPYSESIVVNNLTTDLMNLGLVGVKMGDVNENVHLESAAIAGARSIEELSYKVTRNNVGGASIAIYGKAGFELDGLQMQLDIDNSYGEILSITSQQVSITPEDYIVSDGQATISIANVNTVALSDQPILTIEMSGYSDSKLEDVATLLDNRIAAQLYTTVDQAVEARDIVLVQDSDGLEEGFVLNQNTPNPFIGNTDIRFYNNVDGPVKLTVYDVGGKQITVQSTYYTRGWHKITVTTDELDGPGLYIYELNNGSAVIRKKMMALE